MGRVYCPPSASSSEVDCLQGSDTSARAYALLSSTARRAGEWKVFGWNRFCLTVFKRGPINQRGEVTIASNCV